MYLAKMTTAQAKEAFKKDPIIVIPVGSTEQHGTQSALGTDFMVPSYLADHVEDIDNVIVAPTVPYGVCPYHLSFEGSINICLLYTSPSPRDHNGSRMPSSA